MIIPVRTWLTIVTLVGGTGIGLAAGITDSSIERGRYLATIAACAGCHTPRTPNAAPMSGGTRFGGGPNAPAAANLTPDRETGIGAWTDAQIETAIRDSVRPDGTRIGPPMPQRAYHGLADADVAAIVAYLRSLPPVRNAVVRARRDIAPPAVAARPAPGDRGGYLFAAVTHCAECHAPADGRARTFPGPHGPLTATILAPGGLAGSSDTALAAIITHGVRADGSKLEGPMPVTAFAHLTPEDLAALIGYLRPPAPATP